MATKEFFPGIEKICLLYTSKESDLRNVMEEYGTVASVKSVSYTHLDVYKRQDQCLLLACSQAVETIYAAAIINGMFLTIDAGGFAFGSTCLLYTSRCV